MRELYVAPGAALNWTRTVYEGMGFKLYSLRFYGGMVLITIMLILKKGKKIFVTIPIRIVS